MTNPEFWAFLDKIAHRHRPEGDQDCDFPANAMASLLRRAAKEDLGLLFSAVRSGPSTESDAPLYLSYTGGPQDRWFLCFTSYQMGEKLLRETLHAPPGATPPGVFPVPVRTILKAFDRPEVSGLCMNYTDPTFVRVPKSLFPRRRKKGKKAGNSASGKT